MAEKVSKRPSAAGSMEAKLSKLRTPAVLVAQNGSHSLALPNYMADEVEQSRASIVATMAGSRPSFASGPRPSFGSGPQAWDSDSDDGAAMEPDGPGSVLEGGECWRRPSPRVGSMMGQRRPSVTSGCSPRHQSQIFQRPGSAALASPRRPTTAASDSGPQSGGTGGFRRPLSASATTQAQSPSGPCAPGCGDADLVAAVTGRIAAAAGEADEDSLDEEELAGDLMDAQDTLARALDMARGGRPGSRGGGGGDGGSERVSAFDGGGPGSSSSLASSVASRPTSAAASQRPSASGGSRGGGAQRGSGGGSGRLPMQVVEVEITPATSAPASASGSPGLVRRAASGDAAAHAAAASGGLAAGVYRPRSSGGTGPAPVTRSGPQRGGSNPGVPGSGPSGSAAGGSGGGLLGSSDLWSLQASSPLASRHASHLSATTAASWRGPHVGGAGSFDAHVGAAAAAAAAASGSFGGGGGPGGSGLDLEAASPVGRASGGGGGRIGIGRFGTGTSGPASASGGEHPAEARAGGGGGSSTGSFKGLLKLAKKAFRRSTGGSGLGGGPSAQVSEPGGAAARPVPLDRRTGSHTSEADFAPLAGAVPSAFVTTHGPITHGLSIRPVAAPPSPSAPTHIGGGGVGPRMPPPSALELPSPRMPVPDLTSPTTPSPGLGPAGTSPLHRPADLGPAIPAGLIRPRRAPRSNDGLGPGAGATALISPVASANHDYPLGPGGPGAMEPDTCSVPEPPEGAGPSPGPLARRYVTPQAASPGGSGGGGGPGSPMHVSPPLGSTPASGWLGGGGSGGGGGGLGSPSQRRRHSSVAGAHAAGAASELQVTAHMQAFLHSRMAAGGGSPSGSGPNTGPGGSECDSPQGLRSSSGSGISLASISAGDAGEALASPSTAGGRGRDGQTSPGGGGGAVSPGSAAAMAAAAAARATMHRTSVDLSAGLAAAGVAWQPTSPLLPTSASAPSATSMPTPTPPTGPLLQHTPLSPRVSSHASPPSSAAPRGHMLAGADPSSPLRPHSPSSGGASASTSSSAAAPPYMHTHAHAHTPGATPVLPIVPPPSVVAPHRLRSATGDGPQSAGIVGGGSGPPLEGPGCVPPRACSTSGGGGGSAGGASGGGGGALLPTTGSVGSSPRPGPSPPPGAGPSPSPPGTAGPSPPAGVGSGPSSGPGSRPGTGVVRAVRRVSIADGF